MVSGPGGGEGRGEPKRGGEGSEGRGEVLGTQKEQSC
jgi:hypothetical protein